MNHSQNENEIDWFQCDCIEPRVKINQTDSKGYGLWIVTYDGPSMRQWSQHITTKRTMRLSCWISKWCGHQWMYWYWWVFVKQSWKIWNDQSRTCYHGLSRLSNLHQYYWQCSVWMSRGFIWWWHSVMWWFWWMFPGMFLNRRSLSDWIRAPSKKLNSENTRLPSNGGLHKYRFFISVQM